ncbi:TRAF3-interacting protein 1 isoform X2 [Latimeria chalumnae]|uniref:TRAF3-interacting protein 1 n=1 Tax=Latimeria chalumnae TaxID=7897 RepID=H3AZ77_LATCH|nr:PREDICTED: TRAF3-interacting protein 1 isoform X2 [Latimeria chalumnae]|eukprot:XP_005995997.1 PREDICTED: TRAF3-interacting protein 1 isoform X2 [Latimeria chalumnae]
MRSVTGVSFCVEPGLELLKSGEEIRTRSRGNPEKRPRLGAVVTRREEIQTWSRCGADCSHPGAAETGAVGRGSGMNGAVLKRTQESLGKVIRKPPLTEKLLSKPPFRYLHDIFTEVIRTTGFMKGLYTELELKSDNVKDKDTKIAFLQKTIDVVIMVTGEPLSVKPARIVAGHEPEKTNELLQAIAKCCLNKLSSAEAVKKVLAGEKPDLKGKVPSTPKSQDKENRESKEEDKRKQREKEDKRESEINERSSSRERKDQEPISREESRHKHSERAEKAKGQGQAAKLEQEKEKSRERDRGQDKDAEREKGRERERDREKLREKRERDREREKGKEHERVKPRERASDSKLSRDQEKGKAKEPDRIERKSRGGDEKPPNSKLESTGRDSKPEVHKEVESPIRIPRPSSAKGQRRRAKPGAEDESESDAGRSAIIIYTEVPDAEAGLAASEKALVSENREISDELPPHVTQRRIPRPSSARPAPPRVKRQDTVEMPPTERVGSGKPVAHVIVDVNKQAEEEEDDEQFVVEEAAPQPPDMPEMEMEAAVEFNSEEKHGALVKKILETKKDYETSQSSPKSTEQEKPLVMEAVRKKERELVTKEIEKLRTSIQTLCRSALPLGKIMDYIQEDMDAMNNELQGWRRENKEHAAALLREQSITDSAVEPLKTELAELEQQIRDQQDKNCAIKANILKNEEKIQKMISSINFCSRV